MILEGFSESYCRMFPAVSEENAKSGNEKYSDGVIWWRNKEMDLFNSAET